MNFIKLLQSGLQVVALVMQDQGNINRNHERSDQQSSICYSVDFGLAVAEGRSETWRLSIQICGTEPKGG